MSLDPDVAATRLAVRRVLMAREHTDRPVVVACSGGADSLALLSAAIVEGHRVGLRVIGVTVDHGLQTGSADHAAAVCEQMRDLGVDESVSVTVDVTAPGIGPEAAARRARYEVLEQVAATYSAEVVLLGHTLDDQAETVLLGLTRGSGARSLQGMRRHFDGFARPFLDLTRAQTERACRADSITWWIDPHNVDPAFTRSRLRTEVMPTLEAELGPGVARALARTADQLRLDVAALDEAAAGAFADLGGSPLPVDRLLDQPPAIRRRLLRLAAVAAGAIDAELFYDHVVALDELITAWRGQKWIDLPGPLRGVRRGNELRFESVPSD